MADLRFMLRDGAELAVSSYRIDGAEVYAQIATGGEKSFAIAEVDLAGTLARNAQVEFGVPTERRPRTDSAIEVLELRSFPRGDFRIVEGTVRNVSPVDVHNIVACAAFIDSNGNHLGYDEALIDRSPLRSGGTSNFRVYLKVAGLGRASVVFRQLLGEDLATADEIVADVERRKRND